MYTLPLFTCTGVPNFPSYTHVHFTPTALFLLFYIHTQVEPLYGPTYLPRKFKIAIAVPPSNDVDVFAHDLGFIAVLAPAEEGETTLSVLLG